MKKVTKLALEFAEEHFQECSYEDSDSYDSDFDAYFKGYVAGFEKAIELAAASALVLVETPEDDAWSVTGTYSGGVDYYYSVDKDSILTVLNKEVDGELD